MKFCRLNVYKQVNETIWCHTLNFKGFPTQSTQRLKVINIVTHIHYTVSLGDLCCSFCNILVLHRPKEFYIKMLVGKCVHKICVIVKIVSNVHCPSQLRDYLQFRSSKQNMNLRDSLVLHIPLYKTSLGQTSFKYMAGKDWDSLPNEIRLAKSLDRFKFMVYKHFSELDKVSHVYSIIK